MKQKIIFTLFAISILNILPLIFVPHLITNFKTIILSITAAILWLSQPAFSKDEMKEDRKNDRFSILLILISSCISVLSSVIEWGYFTENKTQINYVTIIGMILLIIGTSIRVWSIYTLDKNFTATVKVTAEHTLTMNGPYKYVRHPSYLGALLAIMGCPIFLNNTVSVFIAFIAMIIAYYIRITLEEKMLLLHFGKAYEVYKKNTYKLFPLIW